MGLAILDPIITLHSALDRSVKQERVFTRTDIRWDDAPIVWVVCLGYGMSVEGTRMFDLIPREGVAYVYTLPDALVNPDPQQTLQIHRLCRERILADMRALPSNVRVSVFAISAGNALGFYVANRYPAERFISVVTGAGLGSELFWSLACIPIARKARRLGYSTGEAYDTSLRGNLPFDNAEHLPRRTHVYLGLSDAQIPVWFGIKMFRQIKKYNPEAKLSLFMLGHVGVMYMVGRFLREGIEPTVYGSGGLSQRVKRALAYSALRVPFRDFPMLIGGLVLGFDRLNRLLRTFDRSPASTNI